MYKENERRCFTFTWTLENNNFCWQKTFEKLFSPAFVIKELHESKYHLGFNRTVIGHETRIGWFLFRDGNGSGVSIDCEFSLLAKDGSVLTSQTIKHNSDCVNIIFFREIREIFDANRSIYLPDDKLTVRCRIWKSKGDLTKNVQCFARTQKCIEKISFLWKIQNFSNTWANQKYTYQVQPMLHNDLLLTLDLISKDTYSNKDLMVIQLVVENAERKNLLFCVTPVNGVGSENNSIRKEFSFCGNIYKKLLILPFSENDLIANKNVWLPNDILTLRCDCVFSTDNIVEKIESICYDCDRFQASDLNNPCLYERNMDLASKRVLNENLKSLFHESILSDIKLKTGNKTLLAHKNILSARSPVFKAMFENNMKEKINECVEIQDLDSDTVYQMLQYIYTAEIEDLQWEKACNLYRAADKYEILSLRDKCSAFLKSRVCPKNVCEVLILADLHQDEELKAATQDFIFNHDIVNSEEWKQFMKSHVKLAADTMYLQIQGKTKSGFDTTAFTGTILKFNPPTGWDYIRIGGVITSCETILHYITCMKEYENKSVEELRVEDYAANRKGRNAAGARRLGSPTSIFGTTATPKPTVSVSAFGQTTQSEPVGATVTTKFPENKLSPFTSVFGSNSSKEHDAFPKNSCDSEKTVTASSGLNISNRSIPFVSPEVNSKVAQENNQPPFSLHESSGKTISTTPAFNNSIPEKIFQTPISFSNRSEKESCKPPISLENSSTNVPTKSSFSLANTYEKKLFEESLPIGKSSEKISAEPSFSFGSSSAKPPVEPSILFGSSSEKTTAKSSSPFRNNQTNSFFKPFLKSSSISSADASAETFSPFGIFNENTSAKQSFSFSNSSANTPFKPFSFGSSSEKTPAEPYFSFGIKTEKAPIEPSSLLGSDNEKKPIEQSFSSGIVGEKTSLSSAVNSSKEQTSSLNPGVANSFVVNPSVSIESTSAEIQSATSLLKISNAKAPSSSVELKNPSTDRPIVSSKIECSSTETSKTTKIICNSTEIPTVPFPSKDLNSINVRSPYSELNSTKESAHIDSFAFHGKPAETPVSYAFDSEPSETPVSNAFGSGPAETPVTNAFDSITPTAESTSEFDMTSEKLSASSGISNSSLRTSVLKSVLDFFSAETAPVTSGLNNTSKKTASASSGIEDSITMTSPLKSVSKVISAEAVPVTSELDNTSRKASSSSPDLTSSLTETESSVYDNVEY